MIRLHIVTSVATASDVEQGLAPYGITLARPATPPPEMAAFFIEPYPGAAIGSWQGDDATGAAIEAAVMAASPGAAVGRGAAIGLEDTDGELGAYDVPSQAQAQQPRESMDRVYDRWRAAQEPGADPPLAPPEARRAAGVSLVSRRAGLVP